MRTRNIFTWLIVILIVGGGLFFYFRYYWVFGTGTKAGILNTFMLKGYVFKTYEGKIIQSGFRANIQSNEFDFSVTDERVANILLQNSGRELELHYKEYFGALPWRGMQRYIVDSVYEIRGLPQDPGIRPKMGQ